MVRDFGVRGDALSHQIVPVSTASEARSGGFRGVVSPGEYGV
jgi:hypothetical protein